MTPKTVIGLGAATVVAAVAAVVSVATHSVTGMDVAERPAFEGLEDRINSAASLIVRTASDSVTVQRSATGWAVTEKGGYPADSEMVRTVLFQLSQLRLMEQKTAMPERYSRIEVEDVDAKDSRSALLTVKTEAGDTLADVIVGKVKHGLAGETGKGVYLRKAGDKQSWLARGDLELRHGASAWLDKRVTDIDAKRVQRITTTRPDGKVVVFSRKDSSTEEFEVAGLPDGKRVKKDDIKDIGGVLSGLRLNDLAAAADRKLAEDRTVQAEVVTFDGLVVNIDLQETDTGVWARFEASAGSGNTDVAKEAETLNARFAGWLFQVPEFKVRPLLKKPDDLVAS